MAVGSAVGAAHQSADNVESTEQHLVAVHAVVVHLVNGREKGGKILQGELVGEGVTRDGEVGFR